MESAGCTECKTCMVESKIRCSHDIDQPSFSWEQPCKLLKLKHSGAEAYLKGKELGVEVLRVLRDVHHLQPHLRVILQIPQYQISGTPLKESSPFSVNINHCSSNTTATLHTQTHLHAIGFRDGEVETIVQIWSTFDWSTNFQSLYSIMNRQL